MTLTDKTGAPVAVTKESGEFTIGVDGKAVGKTEFAERDGQRIFYHTEVDEAFGGRGLATILIGEALAHTRDDGLRIVPVCPMVAAVVRKRDDIADAVDAPTQDLLRWVRQTTGSPHVES
ncbi:MAG: N-acetyltransferase [Actinobacteria bacterium]|nr:N-acetyltransferase [Actinomycetota bacterium]